MMRNVTLDHTGNYDPSLTRHHTDTYPDCTNGFCLQMKGENVRIKARGSFSPVFHSDCKKCGYLLHHYISVSIDLGELAMLEVITAKRL